MKPIPIVHLAAMGLAFQSARAAEAPGTAESSALKPPVQCGSQIRARLIVLQIADASWGDAGKIEEAAGAVRGVITATTDDQDHALAIVVPEDHPLTKRDFVAYLKLAGYTTTPASEALLGEVAARLSGATVTIPPAPTDDAQEDAHAVGKPVPITSLAESLAPLKDHFNAGRRQYRIVALLSPT